MGGVGPSGQRWRTIPADDARTTSLAPLRGRPIQDKWALCVGAFQQNSAVNLGGAATAGPIAMEG